MRQIIELARGCPFSGSSTIDELKTGDVTAGLRPTDRQLQPNSTPHVSPLVAPTLNSCHAPQKRDSADLLRQEKETARIV